MVTLSGFPTALDQETKVDTSAASEVILQWVRDHKIWVGPVVFLLSFLESFAFVSLIVPATFILLGVGALIGAAGVGFLFAWAGAAAGAFAGDWAAFELAAWLGPKLAGTWPISRNPALLDRAAEWFRRWGMATVFFGRFFGPMRAAVPLAAGVLGMPRMKFQIVNLASALIWAGAILTPGSLGLRWLLT
jgi:membrane protein DedA with SNARE-associated domain